MIEYIEVPELGTVRVSRRRGSKTIRIGLTQNGEIRLSMPMRVSLSHGIEFLLQKKSWLDKQRKVDLSPVENGARIGKNHTLVIKVSLGKKAKTEISSNQVVLHIPEDFELEQVQNKIDQAAKIVLKKQAENLLPQQLKTYAQKYGFKYKSVGVKFLQSRWGSCSTHNDIILNAFLMQLPWRLIDYVLLHELCHTRHHNHSQNFWKELEKIMPEYKTHKKDLKKFPTAVFDAREYEVFM